MLIALNKPMNRLSQFTDEGRWQGLSGLDLPKGVYAAGRLDRDSEGLLLLTDDGRLQARITSARVEKSYLALVEGRISAGALAQLRVGVQLKDGPTRPAGAEAIDPPDLWERDPPVRVRKTVPDSWLRLELREGRNRQVRRMCAAVGFPCLRLVRWRIGNVSVDGLEPGQWREVDPAELGLSGQGGNRAGPRPPRR
ncbi:pseudouridine synthase [Palleronia pelagia]|uniref:Pseudouridine synthase n=1 Tax=Palleronia pelagia TaxID=387096 RepID=A0A1H8KP06_9RHOB|nr:pseudouridine synthase [Palleronia pelagia]SEN94683.1 ribosomal large subunit pseudouridine synthase E [Palleronia pelagia]